jgi:hypothetical protein
LTRCKYVAPYNVASIGRSMRQGTREICRFEAG